MVVITLDPSDDFSAFPVPEVLHNEVRFGVLCHLGPFRQIQRHKLYWRIHRIILREKILQSLWVMLNEWLCHRVRAVCFEICLICFSIMCWCWLTLRDSYPFHLAHYIWVKPWAGFIRKLYTVNKHFNNMNIGACHMLCVWLCHFWLLSDQEEFSM